MLILLVWLGTVQQRANRVNFVGLVRNCSTESKEYSFSWPGWPAVGIISSD